jgi:ribonuclease HI
MLSYKLTNTQLKRKAERENYLEIIQLNCNGIKQRTSELKLYLYTKKPDVLCLCETWLHKVEPRFVGYKPVWQHRELGERGGLAFIIREDIPYRQLNVIPYQNRQLEYQALEIFSSYGKINIMNIYNANKNIDLEEFLHYTQQMGNKSILIGDFNAHSPIWDNRGRSNHTGRNLEKLIEQTSFGILNECNVATYIDKRVGTTSCLDLCFATHNLLMMGEMKRGPDIGSDHFPIECNFGININKNQITTLIKWKFNKQNMEEWKANLEKQESVLVPCDAETLNNHICNKIVDASNNTLQKTSGKKIYKRSTPWWDIDCSRAVANRRKAKNLLSKMPTVVNLINYKKCEAIAKRTIIKKKKDSWEQFVGSLDSKTPSAKVWRVIKSMNGKQHTRSIPIISDDNSIVSKANIFANHFSRFNVPTERTRETTEIESTVDNLHTIQNNITPIYMEELLKTLKTTKDKAPGEDNIPNSMIKRLPKLILEELLYLFNVSLFTAVVPSAWKIGKTVPVLKPGKEPSNVESYRPITMLSCIGKLMEKIITRRLEHYLEHSQTFKCSQTGFRRGRGTSDSLAIIRQTITQSLFTRKYCLVVFLDLEGAFDSIWHKGLIYKLSKLNCNETLVLWFKNYLEDRKIKVLIGTDSSDIKCLKRGLAQGAAASPLLFNVMLHDLPSSPDVKIVSYADDITLLTTSSNLQIASKNMQEYLNKLTTWLKKWKFLVNPTKCTFQIYTKKRFIPYTNLQVSQQTIKQVAVQKVLGILLDAPKLTFYAHIDKLKTESNRRVNIIRALSSTTWGASRTMLRRVYISFIRSKIEYGCIIYGELPHKQMNKLNVTQNNAMRAILGARKTTPIVSLEAEAHLMPLEMRFRYISMKWFCRLLCSPDGPDEIAYELGFHNQTATNNSADFFKSNFLALKQLVQIDNIRTAPSKFVSPIHPSTNLSNIISVDMALGEDLPHFNNLNITNHLFTNFIKSNYDNHLQIYTDGSKIENGSVAAAIYIPSMDLTTTWLLNPAHSILGAELFAIYKACELATYHRKLCGKQVVILSDCKSALYLLRNPINPSYKYLTFKIQSILTDNLSCINLQWLKSHAGIKGNEIADRAANIGHNNERSVLTSLCYEEMINLVNTKFHSYWNANWKLRVSLSGKGRFASTILDTLKYRQYLSLDSRRLECVTARLRMGHVGVASHMYRFNMSDSNLCSNCNIEESIEHYLLECRLHITARNIFKATLLKFSVSFSLKNILSGGNFTNNIERKILKALCSYIASTDRVAHL